MAVSLRIPEYSDGRPLAAGEDLTREPAFWLAHLILTMGDPGDDPERYGVDPAAYEEMVERLGDSGSPWPALRVPFAGGHTAYVVYANDEDMSDVAFFVRHPEWGRLGHLGQCGAEGAGPGLSWSELVAVAASPLHGGEGVTDPSQRLLLLLPMLGDADTPDEARDAVARALSRCGIPSDAAAELTEALMGEDTFDDEPGWRVTDSGPVAICSSPYSPRRIPLALGITPDQAEALADALSGGNGPNRAAATETGQSSRSFSPS
ncbi:hypothetical protein ABZ883_08095 [Streptomyces sp. NPDC046977]|uniref:hypothetical protein n=1 Tax=Streptomyces sp. NPDC046977 TaxID=3154703 RepID=UPI0033F6BAAB